MHHNPGSVTLIPILPKGRTLKCDHPAAKRYNNIYRAVWRPSSWNIPHPWQRSLLGLTFWLTPFQEVNKRLLVQLLQLLWQECDHSCYRKLELLFIQQLLAVPEELGLEQNTNPVPTPTWPTHWPRLKFTGNRVADTQIRRKLQSTSNFKNGIYHW